MKRRKYNKKILLIVTALLLISISVGYAYLSTELEINAKINIKKDCTGITNLYDRMKCMSVPDNVKSEFVRSSTGVDFSNASNDTNGKGIYQAVKLEGENTPIYYYRGDVKDNNVIFANKCWKIVRTTETKGVKLIYNGEIKPENSISSCDNMGNDSTIGTGSFNPFSSLAYNGYMYGDVYVNKHMNTSIADLSGNNSNSNWYIGSTNYKYAKSAIYDEKTKKYILVDAENRVWKDTYSSGVTGNQFLYTCFSNTEETCEDVKYMFASSSSSYFEYVTLKGGELAEDVLNKKLIYGNDIMYDEEVGLYTLVDTFTSKVENWEKDRTTIGNRYHYTCLNESGTCSTVKYINYIEAAPIRSYGKMYYVEFSNGVKIETAVKSMTTESKHIFDSSIKKTIDIWYGNNMLDFDEKIEDTPYCNDRTIYAHGGWDKDSPVGILYYQKYNDMYSTYKPVLKCGNKNDAYTKDDIINGNGDLTYKIGLLTVDEISYAGGAISSNNFYLYTGKYWSSASPRDFRTDYAFNFRVYSNGSLGNDGIVVGEGIRPAVSLVSKTSVISGDGTAENPYVVE